MVNLEFVTGKNLLQGSNGEFRICYKEAPAVNLNNTRQGARIKCPLPKLQIKHFFRDNIKGQRIFQHKIELMFFKL